MPRFRETTGLIIDVRDKVATLTAVADAWIEQNSPSNNKSSDSVLKVRSKVSSNNARTLVRFTLPTIPAGCRVAAAKLRLFSDSARTGRTLQAIRVTGSWSESGLTWNNQPTSGGSAASVGSGTGWREWNVILHIEEMYASGASHGFLIRDASEGNDAEQSSHSREKGSNRPQLVIHFSPG